MNEERESMRVRKYMEARLKQLNDGIAVLHKARADSGRNVTELHANA